MKVSFCAPASLLVMLALGCTDAPANVGPDSSVGDASMAIDTGATVIDARADPAPPRDSSANDAGTDVMVTRDVTSDAPVDGAVDAGPMQVAIEFVPRVGTSAFACGTQYDLGTPLVRADVSDFRFYVHDVRLVRADRTEVPVALAASEWQAMGVAMLDFENATGACDQGDSAMNSTIRGTVPPATYTGLKFRLGIPQAINHADVTSVPSPLNRSTLFWGWNAGHIYFAATTRATRTFVDAGVSDASAPVHTTDAGNTGHGGGVSDAGSTIQHFTHIGSTMCDGDPVGGTPVTACARPARPEFTFDFNPSTGRVIVDFAAVKEGSDITTGAGCHSFTAGPCTTPFAHLGIDWATGIYTPASQTVFRVE